jgi:hypothetical protein
VYRPALKPPEFLEPFAPKVDAGHDAFVDEPIAKAIEARLRQLGDAMRGGSARTTTEAERLLAAARAGAPYPFSVMGASGRRRGTSKSTAGRPMDHRRSIAPA